jgi:16S rRNA (adenine1518-N6/adenine1519-N6)-dimethyltransferase
MPVRKRFGQHFLHDAGVIRKIVDSIAPGEGDRVVEIGPGRGALTWALLQRVKTLDVIEIDRDLAHGLAADPRAQNRLQIHVENALKTDFTALRAGGPRLRIVGNLPYNISTPILFHLLEHRGAIADMHFMLQKEVVDRIVAVPGTKQYGRLSVMLCAYAQAQRLFDVGPGAFTPAPKVSSAVIRLQASATPRFSWGTDAALKQVVNSTFSHRRKTLRNGLLGLLDAQAILACGIDPQLRPESLYPEQFGRLAVQLASVGYTQAP